MFKALLPAAVAAFAMVGSANAATFDEIFVESDGFRGSSTGDIVDLDIGLITGPKNVGLGGRIVNLQDQWTFSTDRDFTLSLTDLGIDSNLGYDSASLLGGVNNVKDAEFSIVDTTSMTTIFSVILTSSTLPPAFEFSSGAGSYALIIDGSVDVQEFGSTYDLSIATVPIPAALPLLAAALGMLGVMRRRQHA